METVTSIQADFIARLHAIRSVPTRRVNGMLVGKASKRMNDRLRSLGLSWTQVQNARNDAYDVYFLEVNAHAD